MLAQAISSKNATTTISTMRAARYAWRTPEIPPAAATTLRRGDWSLPVGASGPRIAAACRASRAFMLRIDMPSGSRPRIERKSV